MECIIDNKYKILDKIGAGGTSVVYKAQNIQDESIVAIKVLRDELIENIRQVERFTRESRTLNELSHPNIVNILDVGKMQDGKDYIVMQYIDGMTLKEYIKTNDCLQFDKIVELAVQMCDALGYAHDNGVIHRDIKPQNILLDEQGNARIADFGTARVVDQNTLTMAGRDVIGSVHYIAPEQVKGGIIDSRSDIYSLGITLFEMATGTLPFTGDDAITVAMKHINQSPKRPKDINIDIPKCLNDIILKCISKDPLKRYQTTYELREDLLAAQKEPDTFNVFAPKVNVMPDDETMEEEVAKSNSRSPKAPRSKAGSTRKRKKKKQERFLRYVIILILSIIIIIGGLVFALVNIFSTNDDGVKPSQHQEIIIESMVGKTFNEAVAWAQSAGLRTPKEPEYVVSEVIPEGQVISQSLNVGDVVYKDDYPTITFKVSGGPAKVKVPLLKGMRKDEAIAKLESVGLSIGDIFEVNTTQQSLKIFDQSPADGEMVQKGTKVNIYIAKAEGQPKKTVPNVASKTLEEAKRLLEEANFEIGDIVYESSSDHSPDTVIKLMPEIGSEHEEDRVVSVTIYVSSGKESIYNGNVKIDIPPISPITDVRISYIDENGTEVVFENWTVTDDSFIEGGVWEHNHYDAFSSDAIKFLLYINDELYSESYMLFYDDKGNLLSELPSIGNGG